jgi:hypothetical protein
MSPIKAYLDNQSISDDNVEIECIARKSRMYHLIDGILYRQGANGMMMMCISKEEGSELFGIFIAESMGCTHHGAP